jgi:hypothetical protein
MPRRSFTIASWLAMVSIATTSLFTISSSHAAAIKGHFIRDQAGNSLVDPQTSGLTYRHGELISVSDQSAVESQRMKLFRIDPKTATLTAPPLHIGLSDEVRKGCFGDYLANSPDLEALTWDRIDDTTLITVTEDASRAQLSPACSKKFAQTNSTSYPTLLLKISVDKTLTNAEITAVRPVQFPAEAKVGNMPNDGIEGLAIDDLQNIYLALEKNLAGKPAIFKARLTPDFWARDNFVKVQDANLTLPPLDDKGHPINGIDFMPSVEPGHPGYLIAVARNDDQLWIFDLTNRVPPYVEPMQFYVGTDNSGLCAAADKLVQTALEGIAVMDGRVYLVNDPWKQHYLDNVQCESNAAHFKNMAPLLFSMDVDPRWQLLARPKTNTPLPAISGMVMLDAQSYLAIDDKKIERRGDRLTIVHVTEQGLRPQSVPVMNWPNGQAANDLESICALPERTGEYLIAESGSWQGEFGRLLHIKMGNTSASVLASYQLPIKYDNSPEQTGDQFEGMVCLNKGPNRYLIVLGERGDGTRIDHPTAAASLVVGDFDVAAAAIDWQANRLLVNAPAAPFDLSWRGIADLYLEANTLWAVAVRAGGEEGPFQSIIYPVALIQQPGASQNVGQSTESTSTQPTAQNADQASASIRLLGSQNPKWQLDGIKVEALAAPTSRHPGSHMVIASDDEQFGGIWRALYPPLGQMPMIPVTPTSASLPATTAPAK